MSAELRVERLVKAFSGGPAAVDDVSFRVAPGEIVVLLGPSGCGKTTTLRCIAGLEHPTSGEIAIAGRVVSAPERGVLVPPRLRNLGMVFQSYAVWPHMTVRQNVSYPLRHRRMPRAEITRKVDLMGAVFRASSTTASSRPRAPMDAPDSLDPSRALERLLGIMAALRTPGTGCPWDLEQTFSTVAPYTIEEAYEVADAIRRENLADLRDELGDLLLQIVFHARMAEEAGAFAFGDIVTAISEKLVRRHPHVFANSRDLSPEAVKRLWEQIKRDERVARGAAAPAGQLDGVPVALPALTRAEKLTRKAAAIGFDWPDADQVVAKIREEVDEVADALASGSREAIEDELGDLLFAAANLARHAGLDAEAAARRANAKFERRFRAIEAALAGQGRSLNDTNLDEMERLWAEAKRAERCA